MYTKQILEFVVVGGVDLEYIGVAAASYIECMSVLLYMHNGPLAAAAAAHRIKSSTVFQSEHTQVGGAGCSSRRCNAAANKVINKLFVHPSDL